MYVLAIITNETRQIIGPFATGASAIKYRAKHYPIYPTTMSIFVLPVDAPKK